ncbi:MAG: TIGR01777 family protein, partial [Candidatus Fischerbacteria bacterium RBG_13_37_8]
GKQLIKNLQREQYEIIVLSRNIQKAQQVFGKEVINLQWDGKSGKGWAEYADSAYGIINLAGENIGAGRWTPERKERIIKSRLFAGAAVVDAVKSVKRKPAVIVQASAIGCYGNRGEEVLDEKSATGTGFLAEVVRQWEASTEELKAMVERLIIIRTAVVIGQDGGVLRRLIMPFRYYAGGTLGNGSQWFSWIYLEDQVSAIHYLLKNECEGIFNLCAPEPVRMKHVCKIISKIMQKPCWLHVPAFMLKLLMGQMADELLLTSQKVMPARLSEAGYKFVCKKIEDALKHSILS